VIFVDDGSTDDTLSILKSNFSNYSDIISVTKNCGKADAIREGILYSLKSYDSEYVGFLDADCAFGQNDVLQIVNFANNDGANSAFFASRVKLAGHEINRNPWRHFFGRTISTILNFNSKIKIYDPQCGLKIFKTYLIQNELLNQKFRTRWFIDVELIYRIGLDELKIIEFPIKSWSDIKGSKIKLIQIPRIMYELISVLRIKEK
jgi:glycosyltransferase involved in cell wall biosynthesis